MRHPKTAGRITREGLLFLVLAAGVCLLVAAVLVPTFLR